MRRIKTTLILTLGPWDTMLVTMTTVQPHTPTSSRCGHAVTDWSRAELLPIMVCVGVEKLWQPNGAEAKKLAREIYHGYISVLIPPGLEHALPQEHKVAARKLVICWEHALTRGEKLQEMGLDDRWRRGHVPCNCKRAVPSECDDVIRRAAVSMSRSSRHITLH